MKGYQWILSYDDWKHRQYPPGFDSFGDWACIYVNEWWFVEE